VTQGDIRTPGLP